MEGVPMARALGGSGRPSIQNLAGRPLRGKTSPSCRASPRGRPPGVSQRPHLKTKPCIHKPMGCSLEPSGPEIVNVWSLNGPLLPQNPSEKGGLRPQPFPMGLAVGGGRLDPCKIDDFRPRSFGEQPKFRHAVAILAQVCSYLGPSS